jgi:hypothetical protein
LDDDQLLDSVRRAVHEAGPPPDVVRQARDSYKFRDLAAQIAALEFDSVLDDEDLARVRTNSPARRLTFRSETFTVTLEVRETPKRIVGRIDPPTPMTIVLRQPADARSVTPDAFGYFTFETVGSGAVSVRCTPETGVGVVDTEWVTL